MLFLLALAVPFVTSVRADVALARTLKQVKTDLLAGLAYGASGKSFTALAAGDLLDSGLIPSHYGLQFTVAEDPLDPPTYRYVEFRDDPRQSQSKLLYQVEKEWEAPGTFLQSIVLKSRSEDTGTSVQSVWVVFVPPFGKVFFFSGEALDDLKEIDAQSIYKQVELEFGYKDRLQTDVIRFDAGKILKIQ